VVLLGKQSYKLEVKNYDGRNGTSVYDLVFWNKIEGMRQGGVKYLLVGSKVIGTGGGLL
jgi:hypothetical protein